MTQERSTIVLVVGLISGLLLFSLATTLAESGDLGSFGITVMSGLFQGMLLFLVASGLSIIFGLMDILNLAQGAYFMLGAYLAHTVHHADILSSINPDIRFLLALIVATLVGAVAGVILERGLIRPLYDRPVFQIVLTFGVAVVIGEIIRSIWQTTTYLWVSGFTILDSSFVLFGQQFSLYRLFVIVMGFVVIVLITLLLRRTRIGIIIRAGVEDSAMVEALGINVRLMFTFVFTLGCAVAAFGGGVAAPFLGASLSMGNRYLLGSIAVIVLGGLGSFEGTAIASIIVGLALSVVDKFQLQYLNQTIWSSMTPMILLAFVLLLRPNGLFGKERRHS